MDFKEKDKLVYNTAYKFLIEEVKPDNINKKELENEYLKIKLVNNFKTIFERIIISTQNYNRAPSVIKYYEKKDEIRSLLFDYDVFKISNLKIEDLVKKFTDRFEIKIDNIYPKQNTWYKWCNSIIDSAQFLSEFKDIHRFKKFIKCYYRKKETRIALPLLISAKIKGVGFALACDFLKEIGYTEYAKPDVHLYNIIKECNLTEKEFYNGDHGNIKNQLIVYETLIRMAKNNKITPYKLDKILWLCCTGNFYKHTTEEKSNKGEKDALTEKIKTALNI